jgi:hypothetical protein
MALLNVAALSVSSRKARFSSGVDKRVVETCAHFVDADKFISGLAYHSDVAKQQKHVSGGGQSVIRLDLARLTRAELERVVTERCSKFGTVIAVVMIQDSAHYDFALASVEMSSRVEAMEVLRHLGESLTDDAVLIRLEQQSAA